MVGMAIGAAGQAAAGIVGGIFGAKAARKNRRIIRAARERSKNWYDKEYNSDFTQRADAQAALTKARSILDAKYNQAQGAAAVAGATDESVAQQKAAANDTLAAVTSNIAERADAYKEKVRANYENQQAGFDEAERTNNAAMAQSIAGAASGVGNAFGALSAPGSGGGTDFFSKLLSGGGQQG